jgi:hypothetical protein
MVVSHGTGLSRPYRDGAPSQGASWGAFVVCASDARCRAAVSRLFHLAILTLSRLSIAKKAGSGALRPCIERSTPC